MSVGESRFREGDCVEGPHHHWCGGRGRACVTHSSSVFCAHCEEVAAPNHRPGFRHHEVVVLGTFAQAVLDLHDAIWGQRFNASRGQAGSAYDAARAAVRCARMLELKEEYR